jgi:transcription antitermination factor NusG
MGLLGATLATTNQRIDFDAVGLPASFLEQQWYAVYTCANREKRVASELAVREVEHFLPLYSSVRRWKDRRVCLELPLFPGYVFVRMDLGGKLRVLEIPGVVRLVGFNGSPAPVNDDEMEAMRNGLCGAFHAEPCPYLRVGRRVRVKSGPLRGMEGTLMKKKSGYRFVLSLELIQRAIAVEIDAADVQAIS